MILLQPDRVAAGRATNDCCGGGGRRDGVGGASWRRATGRRASCVAKWPALLMCLRDAAAVNLSATVHRLAPKEAVNPVGSLDRLAWPLSCQSFFRPETLENRKEETRRGVSIAESCHSCSLVQDFNDNRRSGCFARSHVVAVIFTRIIFS